MKKIIFEQIKWLLKNDITWLEKCKTKKHLYAANMLKIYLLRIEDLLAENEYKLKNKRIKKTKGD